MYVLPLTPVECTCGYCCCYCCCADRTPKQKLKVVVTQEPLLALFHKYKDAKGKQAKLKSPLQLQELLDITRQLVKVRGSKEWPCAGCWKGNADRANDRLGGHLR